MQDRRPQENQRTDSAGNRVTWEAKKRNAVNTAGNQRLARAHGDFPEIKRIRGGPVTRSVAGGQIGGDMVMNTDRGTTGGDNKIERPVSTAHAVKHGARPVSCDAKRHGNRAAGRDKGAEIGGIRGNDLAGAGDLARIDQLISCRENADTRARIKCCLGMTGGERQCQRACREWRAGSQNLLTGMDIKPGRTDEATRYWRFSEGYAGTVLFGTGGDILLQDNGISTIGQHRTGENAHGLTCQNSA